MLTDNVVEHDEIENIQFISIETAVTRLMIYLMENEMQTFDFPITMTMTNEKAGIDEEVHALFGIGLRPSTKEECAELRAEIDAMSSKPTDGFEGGISFEGFDE